MARRNILLITTDQQSATMMSCTGNPDLQTPNMDALAADGVRFEKAYAAQPLCVPQRCSWYTGLMPHEHGLTFNTWRDSEDVRSGCMMGQVFRDAGYATGYSGKWHIKVSEDDKERHGFEWMNNIRCNGADEGIVADFRAFVAETGDTPFLFSASFNNPHNICEAARGGPFPDGDPGLPANQYELPALPENFTIPEGEPSIIREIQEMYGDRNYPTAGWGEERWRLHRWYYCRITEILDCRVGELLNALKESGHWDDTLIVFTSDHGDGNAHHHWNQKQVLYDESARVPFIVTKPGSSLGNTDDSQLVNTGIDLIPTLCGLAGIDCPEDLQGLDWSASLTEKARPIQRDHIIIETEFGTWDQAAGIMGRAVRTDRYKYMVYDAGDNHEFLADMENDPGETKNLASTAEFQEVLERHRTLLRDYIQRTGDIFPLERVGVVS